MNTPDSVFRGSAPVLPERGDAPPATEPAATPGPPDGQIQVTELWTTIE